MSRPPGFVRTPLYGIPHIPRTRTDVLSLEAGLRLASGTGAAAKVDELMAWICERGVFAAPGVRS